MDSKSFTTGIILIIIGGVFMAINLGLITIAWRDIWQYGMLWPWLLILAGALLWAGWMRNRKAYGLLMPGTILLVYGLLFWYSTRYGWWYMGEYNLWAFFLIGPGLGFFALYFFGEKEKGMLVPAFILTGLGIVFLIGWHNFRLLWPLILIGIGIRLLLKHRGKARTVHENRNSDMDSG